MRNWLINDGTIEQEFNRIFHKSVTITGVTTNRIIYTPPTDKRFAITDIKVSSDNDDNIFIFDETNIESNNIFDAIVKTSGGNSTFFNHSYSTPYFAKSKNNSIKVTTTTGANVYITIIGFYLDF